jgi:glycosyltransferase involved in cell wall biosynthesis
VDVAVLFGKEISGRGHVIDFVLQSKSACRKPYRAEWNGIRVYVGATDLGERVFSRARKRILDLLNNMRAVSLIRRKHYDFVQVKDRFLSGLMTLVAAKHYGTKYFYWLSYPFPEANLFNAREGTARYPLIYLIRGHLYKLMLYKILLSHADHVFVQSDQMKKDVAGNGIPEWKMTSVPMGVSLQSIPYTPSDEALYSDHKLEKSVVYLGTLIRVRKMDFLIKVFSKVAQKEPHARLYMIGQGDDPQDLASLRQLSSELGIDDRVTFTGFLPMHEAWDYVQKADVCVSPFYPTPILNSTSPTKLIEYMAMGKAVVANDHPEQRQVIRESGAGLCVPYHVDAFADAIVEILQNPERGVLMGQRGREYVERNRSYDRITDMVEETYYLLCDETS